MALSDFWILGFFDMIRIVSSRDYSDIAENRVDGILSDLRKRVNMVRSAFAKLQVPGKKQFIAPSHSHWGGEKGVVYSVYDELGNSIHISRRELADEFLRLMEKLAPSERFRRWIADARPQDKDASKTPP